MFESLYFILVTSSNPPLLSSDMEVAQWCLLFILPRGRDPPLFSNGTNVPDRKRMFPLLCNKETKEEECTFKVSSHPGPPK